VKIIFSSCWWCPRPGPNVSMEELGMKAGLAVEKSIAKFSVLVKEGAL
jgi:hypothetical protein